MDLGGYTGEYSGEMVAPPTWLVVLAAIPIVVTVLLLLGFAWQEWRSYRRMTSSPVHAAAWAMEPDELATAIRALDARERALLEAGETDAADGVAADKMICLVVSDRRGGGG
ncbi:hypothetical protein M2284_003697 [Rhodococcus sp. LBL1]|uniref:Uncharacterized protein n=1 Tax=Prescottella agglutinans TaxID=1644129 RepID=A0ABT6M6P3_9NOCA|nr:hypothetical protein [Prescottella agglutinans]MDH6279960.1 hypothetical protein [Prescottella agglutinans]MDH6679475.1 hypothetical protein [Rhodococcus sp. LBL1]MDH6685386.1 hypothetical protein [Rhodococcus sp. LBL2]